MSKECIRGKGRFKLREGDYKSPFSVEITINDATTANNEFLPYGATDLVLDTFTVKKDDGTDITADIVEGSPEISAENILEMDMSYPSVNVAGDYDIWARVQYVVGGVTRYKMCLAERIKVY